jgi:hydroxymethylpyrimidine pyrophosphatase-like HAD family hydrolase
MSEYKLLVVDIDGTIIDRKGAISDADRQALAAAAAWRMAAEDTVL